MPILMSMLCPHVHYSSTMCLSQGHHAMSMCPDIILFNLRHTCVHHVYTMRNLLSSSQTVDLVFLYFILFFFFFLFYSLIFLFLEHKARVSDSHKSQDAENKVEGSRTNDVIQYEHHMLVLCSTHGYLG